MQVAATAALVVTDLKEERGGLLEWGVRCPTVRLCVIQKRGEITSSGLEFKKPGLLGATVPGTYIKRAAGGEVGSRRVRVTHMARRQKKPKINIEIKWQTC